MPTSIYNYMNENFFDYICGGPLATGSTPLSAQAVPLKYCQCEGLDFYGMPEIEFMLSVDQYSTDYTYLLKPVEFEMVPKIDTDLRTAKCDLGLFNLDALFDDENVDTNEFAIGQNFIRSYNMTLKYVNR